MKIESLSIIAPGLIDQHWNEAEVLGSAVWLWMHSPTHHHFPLHSLPSLLLPAIKHRQFMIVSQDGKPVFYTSWANFNAEAEQRYLTNHPLHMPQTDWNSGNRMWLLDWVAPFGHNHAVYSLLRRQLFANRWMRYLDHRGDQRGLKIRTFCGKATCLEETNAWFEAHPVLRNLNTHQAIKESS